MDSVTPANNEQLIRNDEQMRYRPLGKTGLMVSALSFGCMRLGTDQDLNTALVAKAVECGVNYFETTRFYCGGQCQHRTAPGLSGKAKGVIVSGKCGLGPDTTAYTFLKEIERQLEILGLTHFKFFQVGWFSWAMMPHLLKHKGVLEAIRRAQNEGLIHHIGFTGHDTPANFIKCIETGLFASLTVPYNLINRSYEPAIARAGELGVGVIAMCPVAGGVLSGEASRIKAELDMDMPTTEMALRFVLSNPHVSTACSGMNAFEHLEQNVSSVKAFDPASTQFEELCAGLDKLVQQQGDQVCTACRYCLPCPRNVDIPRYMEIFRNWKCYGLGEWAAAALQSVPKEKHMDNCNQCGACETKCPNHLQILGTLKQLRNVMVA